MSWVWQWGIRSNERAVANARTATTALSRLRVEREEVELFLRAAVRRAGVGRRRSPIEAARRRSLA